MTKRVVVRRLTGLQRSVTGRRLSEVPDLLDQLLDCLAAQTSDFFDCFVVLPKNYADQKDLVPLIRHLIGIVGYRPQPAAAHSLIVMDNTTRVLIRESPKK